MLVGAALVFLALTLPTCLYHLFLYKLYDPRVLKESAQRYLFEQVVYFLADANHAVNFFIYFVTAAKFRRCFVHLLQRLPCCPHPRAAANNGAGSSEAVRLTQLTWASASKDDDDNDDDDDDDDDEDDGHDDEDMYSANN